jgi:RimJ/RimL family protein N-acetyltransferase
MCNLATSYVLKANNYYASPEKSDYKMEIAPSERLSFALMGSADAQLLYELDQDVEVMRYINGGHLTTMEEVYDIFLPRMSKYTNENKGWGLWKVLLRENESFIGWVLVRPMDFFNDNTEWDNLELGWRFKQSAWGKGYATEAATQIKQALINTQSIKKLSAIAMPDNKASIAIMKKLGMHYVKTAIHHDPLGDEEVVYYEMLVTPLRSESF